MTPDHPKAENIVQINDDTEGNTGIFIYFTIYDFVMFIFVLSIVYYIHKQAQTLLTV